MAPEYKILSTLLGALLDSYASQDHNKPGLMRKGFQDDDIRILLFY